LVVFLREQAEQTQRFCVHRNNSPIGREGCLYKVDIVSHSLNFSGAQAA